VRSREENLAMLRQAHQPIAPGQKFEVKDFGPEDAEGIASLYYAVYGETFAVDSVYDPDQIREANATGQVHHVVGRTEAGEVIGLYALFRSPPGRHIMEAGSWIVLPAYRNSTLAMRLAQRIHCNPPERLNLNAIFGQSVCDHLITQKMGEKFKCISCALELEPMPPRPEDNENWSGGRISLLDGFIIVRDVPHAVRPPEPYADTLRRLYAERGLVREFVADGPAQGETRSSVLSLKTASLAKITVEAIGSDFTGHLAGLERDYPGRHVTQLVLPLWQPGMTQAVAAARQAGFFLGGLLPLWADRDALLMQKLGTDPDYSKIQLYTQQAKDLLALVAADRESLANAR